MLCTRLKLYVYINVRKTFGRWRIFNSNQGLEFSAARFKVIYSLLPFYSITHIQVWVVFVLSARLTSTDCSISFPSHCHWPHVWRIYSSDGAHYRLCCCCRCVFFFDFHISFSTQKCAILCIKHWMSNVAFPTVPNIFIYRWRCYCIRVEIYTIIIMMMMTMMINDDNDDDTSIVSCIWFMIPI